VVCERGQREGRRNMLVVDGLAGGVGPSFSDAGRLEAKVLGERGCGWVVSITGRVFSPLPLEGPGALARCARTADLIISSALSRSGK
jgi:hypothetical protein